MSDITKKPIDKISLGFIPEEYLPSGKDPFYYRNKKNGKVECRNLHANEIEILVKNNNFAEDWNNILVTNQFDPNLVKNCDFFGKITIGKLTKIFLELHDLRLPVGISNSTIISCDIGDNVVIRDVHYLSHYKISNQCILFNIDEMITTNHAKFGNGVLKEGEDESLRIWLEICNENEGRKVLPFETMIPADAYIWSKFRDDKKLIDKFVEITDKILDNKRGYYGIIGENSVIKNSRIIKDVKVGEYAYIKGTNKLKNLTVLSSKDEPSQIGEGVELINGIMGYGSKIFYGSKGVRFVTGRNTQIKYGARVINSVLGDNSTVSCCEILNNLIFPFHEQHHNNSFLISTTVLGQSNIAAGATIGSNHNSRTPDGELIAGRGFWPGLCTSFKHNSKFASFVLIAKGSYQYEMNIQYPFSLVLIDNIECPIKIIPAYWFVYNMYAVARNTYKFKKRDKRLIKIQNIEFDYLAPDTVSEMLNMIERIQYLMGVKILESKKEKNSNLEKDEIIKIAKKTMNNKNYNEIDLFDKESMNRHGARIIKPLRGIQEYKKMCIYFALKVFIDYFNLDKKKSFSEFLNYIKKLNSEKLHLKWWNIGGQIISDNDLKNLISDIKNNNLTTWDLIHEQYDIIWKNYPKQKARFAIYVVEKVFEKKIDSFSNDDWKNLFLQGIDITKSILEKSKLSRKKDYESPFRKMTYESESEMKAVIGNILDNPFLKELKKQVDNFTDIYNALINSI